MKQIYIVTGNDYYRRPIMADVPKTVDVSDVQTVIDMTIKAVESVEARKGADDDR